MEIKLYLKNKLDGRILRCSSPNFVSLILLITLIAFVFISLNLGSRYLSFADIIKGIRFVQSGDAAQSTLTVMEFRLPRILVSIAAGGLFALSGALLQGLTRNPLADPSLIGISQGAAVSVVILTIVFPQYLNEFREASAFIGSLIVAFFIQWLSGKGQTLKFILLGIGVSTFISAITSVLLTYGAIHSAASALTWLAGSTHLAQWADVKLLLIVIGGCFLLALMLARTIDVLSLGYETAIGLGVAVHPIKLMILMISVISAAFATAIVGPLGFVGLISTHIAKRMCHATYFYHLINSTLIGAILVVIADAVGRSAFGTTQIAAGLITAILGAPLFAMLLIKKPLKGNAA